MTAYLIQVEGTDAWNKIEIQIVDTDSHYGAAAIFNPLRVMIQFCKFQFIELIKGALLYTFGCVVRCAGLHHTKASLV